MDVDNYEFHFDDSGTKWTGEWTSADDRQLQRDLLVDCPDASDLDYVCPASVKVTATELIDKNIFQRVDETDVVTTDNVSVGEKTTLSGSKRTNEEVSRCDDESLATNRTLVLGSNSDTDADSLRDDVSIAGTAETLPGIQDTDDVSMTGTAETLPNLSGTPKNAPKDTDSQGSDETYKGQHQHLKQVEIHDYDSDDEVSKFSQYTAFTAPGANVAQAYARQNDIQDSDGETQSEHSVPHAIQGTKTRGLPIEALVNYQLEDIDNPPAGNDCQDFQVELVHDGSSDNHDFDGSFGNNEDTDRPYESLIRVGSADTVEMDQESYHTEDSRSNHSKGSTSSMLVKLTLRQRRRANKKRKKEQKKKEAGSPDKSSSRHSKKDARNGTTPPRVGAKSNEA
jgi:hypothetical protein